MVFKKSYGLLLGLFLLYGGIRTFAVTVGGVLDSYPEYNVSSLNRTSFPTNFVFGASSAAYQFEGAWNADGKGPSNWDNFTHTYPDKVLDGTNGDVADDQYNRYAEDVTIMKNLSLDGYRFSISWARILPTGSLSGGTNGNGIAHYNNLLSQLQANGIEPYVTLFHWDIPQALDDEYGGFLSSRVVNDFVDFADICFREFGSRVKYWITLNEPYAFSTGGYGSGSVAPGRCSAWLDSNCTGGDSATEPYIVSHNLLLAHAAAARLYKRKYQSIQQGQIGIAHAASWGLPYSDSESDLNATQRFKDFELGWYLDPMVFGDYPETLKSIVGSRLPNFTTQQSAMLKGSYDFIGLNYYSTSYIQDSPIPNGSLPSSTTDPQFSSTGERNGVQIGPVAGSSWLYIYPPGIQDMLLYVKNTYNNPQIVITECGVDEVNNTTLSLTEQLTDPMRISYYYNHLGYLRKAIVEDGVNVTGFFAWSLLDDYEWTAGFTIRFGLIYIDYLNGLTRYYKQSATWFKSFLEIRN